MSYRITMDGNPFCSSNVEHSAVLDPSVSLEVNKAGKLTFTILPDHPMYDQIALRQSMFDVYQNDELIFEGIATQEDTDFYNRKVISCEGELTFLNDSIQRQAKYTNQSVQSLLGAYLTVHNSQVDADRQFSLGSVTVSEGNGILRYTNFQNTMKEIGEDLIDNYGGYLRVRHQDGYRYLDYLADPPRISSQVIRLGKNLIDYSSNLSSLNIITCLIPRGAKIEGEEDVEGLEKRLDIKSVNSGKDYLVGTAASWYGNVWGTQTWDGVATASALKAKGEEFLEDAQWSNLVISASAIDLGLMEEDVEQFRILDMIRVVSEPHGIDRNFLLSKLDIKLDHPADTQITLGKETKLSLSARSAKNSTEIQSVETRILPSASENAKQILDSSTDGNIYFKFDDQTGKLYEIDIMDTNDPETAQRIWRWNIGGWGYSNDGGQTYTVAATMDGAILASMITTGILKSDDGTTFYLDLDNGVLKGNFSELKISGSAGATQDYADQAEADAVSTAASNTSTAISNYDSGLDQAAVFNKLTNNQANQGIYIENGQLYINASMIAAGILTGREINNGNGTFKVTEQGAVTAKSGNIGGWNISSSAIYKDVADPNDSNIVYRVYLQPPLASAPDSTWVLSCQKSTNGGQSFGGRFILYSNGEASFGSGTVYIDDDGRITVRNAGNNRRLTAFSGQLDTHIDEDSSNTSHATVFGGHFDALYNNISQVSLGSGRYGGQLSLYDSSRTDGVLISALDASVSGSEIVFLSGGSRRLVISPASSGSITIKPTVVNTW